MNGKTFIISVRILIFILFVIGIYKYVNIFITQKYVLNDIFQTAIKLDLSRRVSSPQVNLRSGTALRAPIDSLKGKGVLMQSAEKEVFYPYPNKNTKQIIKIDQSIVDQTATRILNPIQLIQLDSIFLCLLKEKNWKVETGLLYTDSIQKINLHSNKDLSIYSSTFHTDILPLGLENEMTVQAFVRFPYHWLFHKEGRPVLYIGMIWILLCGGYIFLEVYQKKSRKHLIINNEIEENQTEQDLEDNSYKETEKGIQIGKYTYYKEQGILEFQKETISIRRTQEYIVLNSLLEEPNNYCTEEHLLKILDKKEEFINQLRSVISRLRKCFIHDTSIQIALEDNGYRLVIDSDTTVAENTANESTTINKDMLEANADKE